MVGSGGGDAFPTGSGGGVAPVFGSGGGVVDPAFGKGGGAVFSVIRFFRLGYLKFLGLSRSIDFMGTPCVGVVAAAFDAEACFWKAATCL